MPTPHAADTKTRYQAALDCLVSKLQQDRYVLAAILCGSLSHDEVWEKSDIDLLLVGRDERKPVREYCLVEDDINIHALMFSRGEFRRRLEGALQSSFFHSYFSKSTLLFTHDETLREYYEDARRVGGRDRDLQLMQAGGIAFAVLAKAEKWYHVKHDLPYSFLYLCRVVMELATIETLLHDEVPGREVIQQALRHNPDFFRAVYTEFVDVPKTEETVGAALRAVNAYLDERMTVLFKPILEYLAQAGGVRTTTEIDDYFRKQAQADSLLLAYEGLAERGIIRKVSAPLRLTEKSQVTVNEAAYYYDPDPA